MKRLTSDEYNAQKKVVGSESEGKENDKKSTKSMGFATRAKLDHKRELSVNNSRPCSSCYNGESWLEKKNETYSKNRDIAVKKSITFLLMFPQKNF